MKKLLVFLFVSLSLFVKAQINLVSNPSFEQFTECPDYWGQIDYCNEWLALKGSPDYFNVCGAFGSFAVPQNLIGNQLPASGGAYIGVILYDEANFGNDELIGSNLIVPLAIGTRYFVSFKAVFKYNNPFDICCAQNKIGIKFSTVSHNISSPPLQNNFAHVYSNIVTDDTTNWTQIAGSFISDSAYTNIMLGNFFGNDSLIISDFQSNNNSSYYFLDDICVSTDSLYANNYVYTEVLEYQLGKVSVYPNPTIDIIKVYSSHFLEPFQVKINNLLGQEIFSSTSTNDAPIDISGCEDSILILNVIYNDQTYALKIIKTAKL